MSINNSDVVDVLITRLAAAGYVFHDGDGEDIPRSIHWFTWGTNRMASYECGEDCDSYTAAVVTAMDHWFDNAVIPYEGHP